jgi:hypothetical protein
MMLTLHVLLTVAANMDVSKVTWDIWNEPDIAPYFWIRSTQQWGRVTVPISVHYLPSNWQWLT